MIRVLLCEDHELVRMGLSIMIDKADDITLIGEAENGLSGVELAKQLSPDIVLMDIGLPNIDGIEATKRIKEFNPQIKILIFTSRDDSDDVFSAFKSGADGYIMKGASTENIHTAIRSVNEGVAWIDPQIARLVLSSLQAPNQNSTPTSNGINYKAGKDQYGLTEREMEVLALIVNGLTNP